MSLRYTGPLSLSFNNGVVADASPTFDSGGHASAASWAGWQMPSLKVAGLACNAAETSTVTSCSAESVGRGTISVWKGGWALAALIAGSSTEVYTSGVNFSASHARAWKGP